MTTDFVQELYLHFKAGYPLVFVLTQEEKRALKLVRDAASRAGLPVHVPRDRGTAVSVRELLQRGSREGARVVVLDDVHGRLSDRDTLRVLGDLAVRDEGAPQECLVVLAPWVELPPELERMSAVLDLPLPRAGEIAGILDGVVAEFGVKLTGETGPQLVRAAQGLTVQEAQRAFAKALAGWSEDPGGAFESVVNDKKRALRRSSVLENVDVPASLTDVGGLDRLKDWLSARSEAFTDQARHCLLYTSDAADDNRLV